MYYCQLKQPGKGWAQLGAVSYLFHGIINPQLGLEWCRLELFHEFKEKDPESTPTFRAKIPLHGHPVDELQICTTNKYTSQTMVLRDQHARGTPGWSLTSEAPHEVNRQYGANKWLRGFYTAFTFERAGTVDLECGASAAEEISRTPSHPVGSLNEASIHGERILFQGTQQEFVHDIEDYAGQRRVLRFEKQSSQQNSMLLWALKTGQAAIVDTEGSGVTHTLERFSPADPSSAEARKRGSTSIKTPYEFTCGGTGNQVERLHFMEASGRFKHISLPSACSLAGLNDPMLTDKLYWRQQFDSVLEAGAENMGGDDLPHEFITLIFR